MNLAADKPLKRHLWLLITFWKPFVLVIINISEDVDTSYFDLALKS